MASLLVNSYMLGDVRREGVQGAYPIYHFNFFIVWVVFMLFYPPRNKFKSKEPCAPLSHKDLKVFAKKQ